MFVYFNAFFNIKREENPTILVFLMHFFSKTREEIEIKCRKIQKSVKKIKVQNTTKVSK